MPPLAVPARADSVDRVLTVSSELTAAQRARSRRPAVAVECRQTRFGVPILEFSEQNSDAEADVPVDAVALPSGAVVSARNNAGSLDTRDDWFSAWSTGLDTVTAGQGFALAYDPVADVVLLAYGDGNDLKLRTSSDGATWSSTLVTEASAIGSVALAVSSSGDACAFYTLGTTTTLKRLRRTSGTWAGSGTTWSRTGSVATLTGCAAVWRDDFYLVITGTEVTTTHRKVWAAAMGDTDLPTNAWSALFTVQEADASSGLSFSAPHLLALADTYVATFVATEAGNVAFSRPFLTQTVAGATAIGQWREPYPALREEGLTAAGGAALAYASGSTPPAVYLVTGNATHAAQLATATTFADRVQRVTVRQTPTSLKVQLELEDARAYGYSSTDVFDPDPGAVVSLTLGYDLVLSFGYVTAEGAEYGIELSCNISRLARRFDPPTGKRLVLIEAGGPWEQLARYYAPQAWTAPASTGRGSIFQRVAGRAGVAVTASGDLAPSDAWSLDQPTFAIGHGENAKGTLQRLLAPTTDMLRMSGSGSFEICGMEFGENPPGSNLADYGWKADNADPNVLLSATFFSEHEPNQFRVTGADRYFDAFNIDDGGLETPGYAVVPFIQHLRDLDVDDNTKAQDAGLRLMQRSRQSQLVAEAVVPLNAAHELYDVVRLDVDPVDGTSGSYRILELGIDYRRGPAAGAPAYLMTFGLGRV